MIILIVFQGFCRPFQDFFFLRYCLSSNKMHFQYKVLHQERTECNEFWIRLIVFCAFRGGWRLFQTAATRHVHGESLCSRIPTLSQHCDGGTSWSHTGLSPCVIVDFNRTYDEWMCVCNTHTSFLVFWSPAASFLPEKSSKTKPEREAPQRQKEPLIPQESTEAWPKMRHGQ